MEAHKQARPSNREPREARLFWVWRRALERKSSRCARCGEPDCQEPQRVRTRETRTAQAKRDRSPPGRSPSLLLPSARAHSSKRRSSTKSCDLNAALLASGCAGFIRTLRSVGTTAEGTNSRHEVPPRSHASPASMQKG